MLSFLYRGFVFLVLIYILSGVFAVSGQRMRPVDMAFPAEKLGKLAGSRFSADDLKGKVSVIKVFASWCGYCRREMPIAIKIREKNLAPMYGIVFKDEEKPALKMIKEFGNPFAGTAYDPDGDFLKAVRAYGVPVTLIVDHNAKIRYHISGMFDEAFLNAEIIPAIEKLKLENQGQSK